MQSTGFPVDQSNSRSWHLFNRLDGWLLRVEQVAMVLAALVVLGMFSLLIAGVLSRPWTPRLFTIALEGGGMTMWPLAYLGAGYVWRIRGHVQFDMFLRKTRGRKHFTLQLLHTIASLFLAVVVVVAGWRSFEFQYAFGSGTQLFNYLYWPFYWPVFVGTGILAVELVFASIRHVRSIIYSQGSEYDDLVEAGPVMASPI